VKVLKGWLSEEVVNGGVTCRRIFFRCPGNHERPHTEDLPVTLENVLEVRGQLVWQYKFIKDKYIKVTPSIDASGSSCDYHDFFEFELVETREEITGHPAGYFAARAGLDSVNPKEQRSNMKTLEDLLNTTVEAKDKDENPIQIIPEFRVAVQADDLDGVRIIIHPMGYNGDTLDLVVKGNTVTPLN
jgi:hypothetical protein